MDSPIEYVNRVTGETESEVVMGDALIRFAYNTACGRSLWGFLFNHAFLSRCMGCYFSSRLSKWQIRRFIRDLHIDTEEAKRPVEKYGSFNTFFARKLKPGTRPFEPSEKSLSSPADGRLLAYENLSPDSPIPVKGANRTLNHLCEATLPSGQYSVIIVRLCPADYHRYHFPCFCHKVGKALRIAGKYHSVNPTALMRHPNLLVENTRAITVLESSTFGTFRYIEVGAFGVGSIVDTAGPGPYPKMSEKGYFLFGGSTVILIFDSNRLAIDADLLENTAEGLETRVRAGNEIGSAR